jgi:hypothetical protein
MSEKGFFSSLFGGGTSEVQIPLPAIIKPKKEEDKPFDIERAKRRLGRFPPQSQLFIDTARREGHLSHIALAALIDPAGYTLDQVEALWTSGDVSERSTYVVLTHGLLPPREVLRYEYSAELLNTSLGPVPRGATESEVAAYFDHPQSFTINVPQSFRVYVFCSEASLVEGRTAPEALSEGRTVVTLATRRHSIGSSKSDGSTDHTFGFTQRVALFGAGDLREIPAGTLRFIARAELVRS